MLKCDVRRSNGCGDPYVRTIRCEAPLKQGRRTEIWVASPSGQPDRLDTDAIEPSICLSQAVVGGCRA